MFVIYYFGQDYDYCEKEIVAVSSDKTKIEKKKQDILNQIEENQRVYKKWNSIHVKAMETYRERLKNFLLSNLDAIRNPSRKDGLWVKEKPDHKFLDTDGFFARCRIRPLGCGNFNEPEPPLPEIEPFSKQEEEYVKKQEIETLSWNAGEYLISRLFLDKLNGPIPELTDEEKEAIDVSKAPFYDSRNPSEFIIEEVQEI